MRAFLASPLGFLIGLSLGTVGGGGSILAVPALVYAAGQDPRAATATSLLLVGTAALVGMGAHYRARRVHVGTGLLFGLAGIPGAIAGTAINHSIDGDVLLLGFSALTLLAAWRMLVACPTCTNVGEGQAVAGAPRAPRTTFHSRVDAAVTFKVAAAGCAIGLLTGLFGVGGGFVIVPSLTLFLGFAMPDAIGTSLLVIAVNSGVALVLRLGHASIEWGIALPFTVAAVAGVLTGKQIADRLDAKSSLRGFASLLVAVALYTAINAGVALAR
jgi:uncharacterized protein